MTDKREDRRQRAEQAKELKERQERRRVMRTRLFIAAAVLAVVAVGFAVLRKPPAAPGGKVWSAEHGHWHDQ